MLAVTQEIAANLAMLERARPAAILTEFDRNAVWAPLILAARQRGISTFTLVHGVIGKEMVGVFPLLADKVFCWGELDRAKFLAAGVKPSRAVIGGCPRLSRELNATPTAARIKAGLDPAKPVVMAGTTPIALAERLRYAEAFCEATKDQTIFSAVVRLHPVDRLREYAALAAKYPHVKFMASDEWTLDEALAAANVVVVHTSGLGADALVKGRLCVVLNVSKIPLSFGQELVAEAHCPLAESAALLRDILGRLFTDADYREELHRCAENYVARFCQLFGNEASRQIAARVIAEVWGTAP
jgi:hypothetical protein